MSFAETSSAATASIVVSPWATVSSCMGPHAVGVIAPENVPVPVAAAGSWVVFAVHSDAMLEPVHPGRTAFGVTNPIFLRR